MPVEQDNAIRELVADWLDRAQADLAVATMTDNMRITPEILAFHAQQAAEKGLKALLVWHQVDFPHTHVIGILLNLCRNEGHVVPEILVEAAGLTPFAVTTRYPGEREAVSREEARWAAGLAERVVAWVVAALQETE